MGLIAADKYRLDELKLHCENCLMEQVCEGDVLWFFSFYSFYVSWSRTFFSFFGLPYT